MFFNFMQEMEPPDNCFVGESIAVRVIYGCDGRHRFGLYRPYSKDRSCILEYINIVEANFIARYIEEHGGSCDAAMRRAARDAWLEVSRETA